MGLSKSHRILILLAIDSAFFLLELVVGYAVHSLALVADSFHMLNDVLSLCVGLWAVKVANQKTNSKMYTYGWQRAETLGALINGVFLVALCLSIFLEAIQRLVEPQEVSHPKLVLIVGCFGLASNIIGLFLFHDHGHSHGGHGHGGHSHGHNDEMRDAEEGHSHGNEADDTMIDDRGNIADVLPSQGKGRGKDVNGRRIVRKHRRSKSRGYNSLDQIPVHPASFRNDIISASRMEDQESETDTESDNEVAVVEDGEATETSPLLQSEAPKSKSTHADHKHRQPKEEGKKGEHSHGDLNMRGVFLHVMGDALGNIGVIGSALIIWLTKYSWRFYADPVISLIITVIILCSAIPLCKAASRILLQAVPAGISIDDIKDDISELDGIISCHHLHVWQLSDTKLVASLHVQVGFDFKGEGAARYMALAHEIRECLHEYGIHSSTIQPEFCLDENHDHSGVTDESDNDGAAPGTGSRHNSVRGSRTASVHGDQEACLLACGNDCENGKQCCAAGAQGCASAK
ncbi:zinc/cadmium resistance protein-like protein [Delitschia confertaspora ATCC 74209]|uniref:Zinc/cadmium resistance protein-like protein n=1 Tax=Delitschia confertaspora ATCC 74209 TaxID=1513339 RepID=A0A9P4JJ30_9PLEO|nr:zinc/cadmium resistance protein-like protein [Delitschia confertaspora ATCC 74209]